MYTINIHKSLLKNYKEKYIYIYIYISNSTTKVAHKIYKAMPFKGSKDPRPLKQRS